MLPIAPFVRILAGVAGVLFFFFFFVELLITADLVRSFIQFVATATGGAGKTADVGTNDLFVVNVDKKAYKTDASHSFSCLNAGY